MARFFVFFPIAFKHLNVPISIDINKWPPKWLCWHKKIRKTLWPFKLTIISPETKQSFSREIIFNCTEKSPMKIITFYPRIISLFVSIIFVGRKCKSHWELFCLTFIINDYPLIILFETIEGSPSNMNCYWWIQSLNRLNNHIKIVELHFTWDFPLKHRNQSLLRS